MKEEATVEGILTYLAQEAEDAMRRFAEALETRLPRDATALNDWAYAHIVNLQGVNKRFELPGSWNAGIEEMWAEYHRLAALWHRIQTQEYQQKRQ